MLDSPKVIDTHGITVKSHRRCPVSDAETIFASLFIILNSTRPLVKDPASCSRLFLLDPKRSNEWILPPSIHSRPCPLSKISPRVELRPYIAKVECRTWAPHIGHIQLTFVRPFLVDEGCITDDIHASVFALRNVIPASCTPPGYVKDFTFWRPTGGPVPCRIKLVVNSTFIGWWLLSWPDLGGTGELVVLSSLMQISHIGK